MPNGHGRGRRLLDNSSLFVIVLVSLLHMTWAGLLVGSAAAAHSTPVSAIVALAGGSRIAAEILLFGGAVAALVTGYYQHSAKHADVRPGILALGLIPQQFLLLVSAAGGIVAVAQRHYADGVVRPWQFILGDQLPIILVALLYTTAIVVIDRPRD